MRRCVLLYTFLTGVLVDDDGGKPTAGKFMAYILRTYTNLHGVCLRLIYIVAADYSVHHATENEIQYFQGQLFFTDGGA